MCEYVKVRACPRRWVSGVGGWLSGVCRSEGGQEECQPRRQGAAGPGPDQLQPRHRPFPAWESVNRTVLSPQPLSASSAPRCRSDKAQLPNCCLGAPPTADRQRRKSRRVPRSSLALIPGLCQGHRPKAPIPRRQAVLTLLLCLMSQHSVLDPGGTGGGSRPRSWDT